MPLLSAIAVLFSWSLVFLSRAVNASPLTRTAVLASSDVGSNPSPKDDIIPARTPIASISNTQPGGRHGEEYSTSGNEDGIIRGNTIHHDLAFVSSPSMTNKNCAGIGDAGGRFDETIAAGIDSPNLRTRPRYKRRRRALLHDFDERPPRKTTTSSSRSSRYLVMVRPPSRHTYGFVPTYDPVESDEDDASIISFGSGSGSSSSSSSSYDLPLLELKTLLVLGEGMKLEFVPVEQEIRQHNLLQQHHQLRHFPKDSWDHEWKPTDANGGNHGQMRNRMQRHHPAVPLLYWMKLCNGVETNYNGKPIHDASSDDTIAIHAGNDNSNDVEHAKVDTDVTDDKQIVDRIGIAASRAILTHAAFSIEDSFYFSAEHWKKNDVTTISMSHERITHDDFDANDADDSKQRWEQARNILNTTFNVIDMTNPNMSRDDRSKFINRILSLLWSGETNAAHNDDSSIYSTLFLQKMQQIEDSNLRIRKTSMPMSGSSKLNTKGNENVLLHHTIMTEHPQSEEPTVLHCIHFGKRIAIGPAGTRGSPGQTLRRTHHGILKEYALKYRKVGGGGDNNGDDKGNEASDGVIGHSSSISRVRNTETAMEPQIGFLMANFALGGRRIASSTSLHNQLDDEESRIDNGVVRVLDPCCGSGSLLLYAAALGVATELVGVDSDATVWNGAKEEFARHTVRSMGTIISQSSSSSSLPIPQFYRGDILIPSFTEALWKPNAFHAIICDPPYNIGAPVLVNGMDVRPRNYHEIGNSIASDIESSEEDCVIKAKESLPTNYDLTASILGIARRVLVDGGRIVFFLPVRGAKDMAMTLEDLLVARGCCRREEVKNEEDEASSIAAKHSTLSKMGHEKSLDGETHGHLRLLFSRLQRFTRTFSRWIVCMEKLP